MDSQRSEMAEPWPSYSSSSSRGKKKRPRSPNDDATTSQGRTENSTSLEDNLIFSDTLIALQLMRTQFPNLEKGEAGSHGNDQGSSGAALNAGGDEDGARAFIAQVKEELERCLGAGMNKEQMFQELRVKGFHPAAAFAVYKELRDQNNVWFKEYYVKMDLRKQAERLELLQDQYRTVRAADAAARAQGTAGQQTAMAVPNDVGLPGRWTVPAGLDGTRLLKTSSSGGRQFAAASPQLPSPVTMMHVPTGQPLHQREQPVPNSGVQGVLEPSAACNAFNDPMAVTYKVAPIVQTPPEVISHQDVALKHQVRDKCVVDSTFTSRRNTRGGATLR